MPIPVTQDDPRLQRLRRLKFFSLQLPIAVVIATAAGYALGGVADATLTFVLAVAATGWAA
jgi:hypothetical protein